MKVVAILATVGFLATVVSEARFICYSKEFCEGLVILVPQDVGCCDNHIGGKSYELATGCNNW